MIKFNAHITILPFKRRRLIINYSSCLALAFLFSYNLIAQTAVPLTNNIIQHIEPVLMAKNPGYFTCLKPYDRSELNQKIHLDSLLARQENSKRRTWFGRKFLQESFFQVDSPQFQIKVDPLFNFALGKESGNNQSLITNTRGILIRGSIGKTIGFESSLYENQEFFPMLMDSFIEVRRIVPGQGRAKPYHKTGWDFAYSSASIAWRPGPHFFLQLATDKLFVGEGYRSLLLSDIAMNYPFIRYTISFNTVQYTRILAGLTDIDYSIFNKDTGKFPGKTLNIHLLSTQIFKTIQVSVFEGNVLKNPDNLGRLHVNYNLISPVPFLDFLYTKNAHPILGLNLKWNATKSIQIYNQWVLDNFVDRSSGSPPGITNYGLQGGIKYFNAAGIKNLYLQAEYNAVQPNTYAKTDSTLAYTNFSQPLTHPLGSNFSEFVLIMRYNYQRLQLEYKETSAIYGSSKGVIFHGDAVLLPVSYPQSGYLAGQQTHLTTHMANISFNINPATNSSFSIGMHWRKEHSPDFNRLMKYVFISFSTNMRNLYSDF